MFSRFVDLICTAVSRFAGATGILPAPTVRQLPLLSIPEEAVTTAQRSFDRKEFTGSTDLRRVAQRPGPKVVILVIGLSSSISAMPKEYAQGYTSFINSLRVFNPTLVRMGFDSTLRLLYQGPVTNASEYTEEHFSQDTRNSILGHGTAFYRSDDPPKTMTTGHAFLLASRLARESIVPGSSRTEIDLDSE